MSKHKMHLINKCNFQAKISDLLQKPRQPAPALGSRALELAFKVSSKAPAKRPHVSLMQHGSGVLA